MTSTPSTRLARVADSVSIDYAVMEKAANIAVLPGDFGWSDVGSFAAIPEVRPADAHGNVVSGTQAVVVDCHNCVVLADKRPLSVVGLTDMVVVDSGDAVLVVQGSAWPGEVAFTVHAAGSVWVELSDAGALTERRMHVRVEGRGAASRPRSALLARAG